MARKTPLKINDQVAYSAKFLKQIGADYEIASMRGEVVEIVEFYQDKRLIRVRWTDGEVRGALECNLAKVGSVHFCDPSA